MGVFEFVVLVLIGLVAGSLSGMLGIGGGIVMIPALIYILHQPQLTAQGTSLAVMIPPISLVAVMNYYKAGYVNLKYAFVIIIFFIVGTYLSSKVSLTINPTILRKIFAVFIFAVAVKMFFQK